MVDLLEDADDSRMVNARNHDREKVREKCWLLLKVELQSFVVAITPVLSFVIER